MGQLTIEQLIKIILGVFVVVVVIIGLYFFFKEKIMVFIKNLSGETPEIFSVLLK